MKTFLIVLRWIVGIYFLFDVAVLVTQKTLGGIALPMLLGLAITPWPLSWVSDTTKQRINRGAFIVVALAFFTMGNRLGALIFLIMIAYAGWYLWKKKRRPGTNV